VAQTQTIAVRTRLIINIVLFISIVALALFISSGLNDKTSETDVSLTGLDVASINKIKIMRSTSGDILFQKENGKWWMQEPYHMPANEFRINTMLNLPGAHSYTQFRKDDVELERFLLHEPEVTIEFDNTRIDFGDTSPLGEHRYVLVNDTVHLINDSLYQQLQTPATFFLSTKLLPEDKEIKSIQFPGYTISKQENKWNVEPEQDAGSDDMVKLVHAWRMASAISIRDIETGDNLGTVRVELEDGASIEIVILNPLPQLILARPDIGLQYHISSYDAENLFLRPASNNEPPVTY
jgi:hypothetical protein